MITDRLRVTAENVGIEVHRSRQIRRRRKAEFSLTVLDVKVAREHRLSVLHDVEISGPSFLGGEESDPRLRGIAAEAWSRHGFLLCPDRRSLRFRFRCRG